MATQLRKQFAFILHSDYINPPYYFEHEKAHLDPNFTPEGWQRKRLKATEDLWFCYRIERQEKKDGTFTTWGRIAIDHQWKPPVRPDLLNSELRQNNPAQFVYTKHAFRKELCRNLIKWCEYLDFGPATFADGTFRDNVMVRFIKRKEERPQNLTNLFLLIERYVAFFGSFFQIDTWPQQIEEIQVARYLPGDHYNQHPDHDDTLQNLPADRKLTLFVSLTPNGQFQIQEETWNVSEGDAIIFPSWIPHAAPMQVEGIRYSFAAWIPGPNWR